MRAARRGRPDDQERRRRCARWTRASPRRTCSPRASAFPAAYTDTLAQWRFFDQVVERVCGASRRAEPRRSAAGLPAARQGFGGTNFAIEGQTYLKDKDYPAHAPTSVTPELLRDAQDRQFDAGRVLHRRAIAPARCRSSIVNKAFVDKFFKNVDPIGQRIRLGGVEEHAAVADDRRRRRRHVHRRSGRRRWRRRSFSRSRRRARRSSTSRRAPAARRWRSRSACARPWRRSIRTFRSTGCRRSTTRRRQSLWFVRVFGTMFMIFGFVALFLASVGLYAVMSFSVQPPHARGRHPHGARRAGPRRRRA